MNRVRGGLGIAVATLCAVLFGPPAAAQIEKSVGTGTGPVLFKADELRYDRELAIIVATGHVEFSRGESVLMADTVTYNQREDTVAASGHVTLLVTGGQVMFADYMALSGDLKDGLIRNLRARFSDNSRVAANGARRIGGVRNEMAKAVYTPCAACAAHPERAPLWQLRADEVVHDEVAHEIKYYDATMEMFGVPVMYLPYFQHPDPTVEKKTGFLAPSFGSDSELGKILRVPYFINLAPNRDLTLDPIITTNEGPVLAGEYRERYSHGELQLAGSVTEGSAPSGKDEIRGHVKGFARFDLGDHWRTGADIFRTSDDTYLARYGFELAVAPHLSRLPGRVPRARLHRVRGLFLPGAAIRRCGRPDAAGPAARALQLRRRAGTARRALGGECRGATGHAVRRDGYAPRLGDARLAAARRRQ